jgi:hypothetical protein
VIARWGVMPANVLLGLFAYRIALGWADGAADK